MKYVFIAHSHTLLLTSLGVIDYLSIPARDVVFLLTRGYRSNLIPTESTCIQADDVLSRYYDLKNKKNRPVMRSEIAWLDRWIEDITGGPYSLFVPHLWSPMFKILQTNRNCCKVSFVQEGAYTVERFFHNRLGRWQRLVKRAKECVLLGTIRLYGDEWYTSGELCHQTKPDAYAIYPEYFKYLDCNLHLVRWPENPMETSAITDGPVFVYDGFVKHGICRESFYLECCRKAADMFGQKKNYLKFHPAQSQLEKDSICSIFEELGLDYSILNDSIPLEFVINNPVRQTFVGFGSSLLYFAIGKGHTVHCMDRWLMEDSLYQAYHANGVPFFDEYFSLSENALQ